MKLRFLLIGSGALAFSMSATLAEPSATNLPPGAVVWPSATNAQPETPAPPQANAKSAPGAQSPNGANGITIAGKPVTKGPNTPSKKGGKQGTVVPAAEEAAAPVAVPGGKIPPSPAKQGSFSLLDNYVEDLNKNLKLSADEKKDIQTYYIQDAVRLHDILNNAAVPPEQQAEQVSDLRGKRNDKIEALLGDTERRHEFFKLEANYRVALTEAAADGTLCPAETPAPAPVPAPSDISPGQAEPIPTKNAGNQSTVP